SFASSLRLKYDSFAERAKGIRYGDSPKRSSVRGFSFACGRLRSIAPTCSYTHNSSHDPNYGCQCNCPRCEKCQGYANHSQAPRQRCCALSECISQRGDETGLGRNDVALAVNLDRHVSRGVCFVDLCAGTILPLHADVLHFPERAQGINERVIISHRDAECDVCKFATVRISRKR